MSSFLLPRRRERRKLRSRSFAAEQKSVNDGEQTGRAGGNCSGVGVAPLEREVGPEVYQELLAAFMDGMPLMLVELSRAASLGDVKAGRYVGHQIVGTASGFGADRLGDLGQRLLWIGSDQGEVLRSLVDKIEREVCHLQLIYDESAEEAGDIGDGTLDPPRETIIGGDDVDVPSLESQVGPEQYHELPAAFLHMLTRQLA